MRGDLDDNTNKAKYKLEYITMTANVWLFITTAIVESLNLENSMTMTMTPAKMQNYIRHLNKQMWVYFYELQAYAIA